MIQACVDELRYGKRRSASTKHPLPPATEWDYGDDESDALGQDLMNRYRGRRK
jgi:hypothetical protein